MDNTATAERLNSLIESGESIYIRIPCQEWSDESFTILKAKKFFVGNDKLLVESSAVLALGLVHASFDLKIAAFDVDPDTVISLTILH
jgi:hypothetical protein